MSPSPFSFAPSGRDDEADRDPLGAFVPGPRLRIEPTVLGPLAGVTFAIKDIIDTAGQVTGCGNPDWAASHTPAEVNAPTVDRLLAMGATAIGKTVTDELAYSLNGQNAHYGTPTNSNAPGRIPGGSSSGSAAAVAGGLADVALGSDTGGSVRVPASYCGICGLRTSHGRIALDGIMPLAPSFDTIGWFARDAQTLARVGGALLEPDSQPSDFTRLLVADDAFALAQTQARAALAPEVARLVQRFGQIDAVQVGEPGGGLAAWMLRFRTLQAQEIWQTHGAWIEQTAPRFGPEIAERFDWVRTVGSAQAAAALVQRAAFAERLQAMMTPGTLMVLPSAPDIAPLTSSDAASLRDHRSRVLSLTCIAGLAGLPQVSLPLAQVQGCPLGLSLIAPRGADRALLAFAAQFAPSSSIGDSGRWPG
ncbi:amidase [Algihabitans albus]|uniref:amidase n=1 Tax=Algihabitans albus TaxID=2164067 RepID=UPI000E5D1B4D|nr:amidase [Algihabitans albus]